MYSHTCVGVTDFGRALDFYRALMAVLGLEARFCDADTPWAGWQSAGQSRPLFLIGKAFDGQPHDPGNGQMIAFNVENREQVRAAHTTALAHGGRCEGPPGLRAHYHDAYYGAYFRDTEGNKLCVVCHAPA